MEINQLPFKKKKGAEYTLFLFSFLLIGLQRNLIPEGAELLWNLPEVDIYAA